MAGGIDLINGGFDPWANVTAGAPLSALSSVAGFSNPISAGLTIMSALSSPSLNKSGAGANSASGFALFDAENTQAYKKPLLDFSSPSGVLIASAVIVAAVWAYKKYKG